MIFFLTDTPSTWIYTFPTRRSSDLVAVFCIATFNEERVFGRWSEGRSLTCDPHLQQLVQMWLCQCRDSLDRKSTRLNSSHTVISYAVFCLKKKTQTTH